MGGCTSQTFTNNTPALVPCHGLLPVLDHILLQMDLSGETGLQDIGKCKIVLQTRCAPGAQIMSNKVCTKMLIDGHDCTDCTVKGLHTQAAHGDSLPEIDEQVWV